MGFELIERSAPAAPQSPTPRFSIEPGMLRRRALGVTQELLELSGLVHGPEGTTLTIGIEGEPLRATALIPTEDALLRFEARLVLAVQHSAVRRLMLVATFPDGSQLTDSVLLDERSTAHVLPDPTPLPVLDERTVIEALRCGNEPTTNTIKKALAALKETRSRWKPLPEPEIWARRWEGGLSPAVPRPRHRLGAARVQIVTTELRGPTRLTDAGTRAWGLAEALAAAGHPVSILFLAVDSYEVGNLSSWAQTLRGKGITLTELPPPEHDYCIPEYRERALRVFEALKQQEFEVLHFFGDISLAHYSLYAKRQGIAFSDSTVYVHATQPERWARIGNGEYPFDSAQLEREFMQRESIAGADFVVTGSKYMSRWIREAGWCLPSAERVIEHPAPLPPDTLPRESCVRPDGQYLEIAFIGRPTDGEGLELFLSTAELLAQSGPLNVTILGPNGKIRGIPSELLLDAWAERHVIRLRRIADYCHHEISRLLVRHNAIAVLPYLHANRPVLLEKLLRRNIPTVTTMIGGIPEIPAEHDRFRMVEPKPQALAQAVRDLASSRVRSDHPLPNETPSDPTLWAQNICGSSPETNPHRPLVSICIAHKDRPRFLEQALDSVAAQSYQNIEVVITDDGSEDPEALSLLSSLESAAWRFPLTVVRQKGLLPSGARNVAAFHARGRYLFFLDDDNLMKPAAIERLVQAALLTNADALTCALDFFASAFTPSEFTKPHSTWVPSGPALELGGLINCYGDTFSLFDRASFFSLGGFREEVGGLHEDWEIFARAVLGGKRLEVVPEALAWYRYRPEERRDPQFFFRARQISLEPFLAAVPAELRPALRLVQGIYGAREEPIAESLITFAPDEIATEDLMLPRLLYRADERLGFEGIAPEPGCKLSSSSKGLEIMADTEDPGIILPVLDFGEVYQLDVIVEIASTSPTTCQLYYLTRDNQRYNELHSLVEPIGVGPNSVTFSLRDVALVGALRIDPGAVNGIYVIHSIECRANLPEARG